MPPNLAGGREDDIWFCFKNHGGQDSQLACATGGIIFILGIWVLGACHQEEYRFSRFWCEEQSRVVYTFSKNRRSGSVKTCVLEPTILQVSLGITTRWIGSYKTIQNLRMSACRFLID